jgi:hypothetical protein
MKNIVCPVSSERIPENLPRVTAFLVLTTLLLYVFTGFIPLVLYLVYDFLIRGYNLSDYSIFHKLSVLFLKRFGVSKTFIDKAPKMFAARLGGFMGILIVVFHLFNLSGIAIGIAGLIIVLSTLECVIGLCVGCYIYSLFVLPFYRKAR